MTTVSNWLLALLVMLFGFWFWSSTLVAGGEEGPMVSVPMPTPMARPPVPQRVFPLPSDKTIVIDARVNRDPLPPEYQAGYEIKIDATGHVKITVTEPDSSAGGSSVKREIMLREVGVAGLQALLNRLDQAGYFRLAQLRSAQGPRVGGPGNVLSITLADGNWRVDGAELSPAALLQLQRMQGWVAQAVGFQPPASLAPGS